jgi:phosphotransferase system enzyme I (PtsP)
VPREEDKYLQKIKELDLIWRLNEQIMSFRSLGELLDSILKGALEIMEATSGSIMLIEPPGSDTLVIKASKGLRKEVVRNTVRKVGEGIAGMVAQRREGMLLLDDLMDPRLRTRRKVSDALSVPIVLEGELLGVLNLNTRKNRSFNQLDLFFLNTLTQQIARAIDRGRKIEELRRRLSEVEEAEREAFRNMEVLSRKLEVLRKEYQRIRMEREKITRELEKLAGPIA